MDQQCRALEAAARDVAQHNHYSVPQYLRDQPSKQDVYCTPDNMEEGLKRVTTLRRNSERLIDGIRV